MDNLANCFVVDGVDGLTIIDVVADADGVIASQTHTFTALEPLNQFLNHVDGTRYLTRYMCVPAIPHPDF